MRILKKALAILAEGVMGAIVLLGLIYGVFFIGFLIL